MASVVDSADKHFRQRVGDNALAAKRPGWQDLSGRYPNDRDCLASYLALELAEVLEGAKPANLVCLSNKRRSCGRNLYLLWKGHGEALIEESGLLVRALVDRGSSLLLLIYREEALTSVLAQKAAQVILGKAGYREPSDFQKVLSELEARVAGTGFPHEIGVFLGYPLKDVIGFLGWAPLAFTCQGPWKIFGNPAESLRLAEAHRECRCRISSRLAAGCSPHDCLKSSVMAFFD